MSGSRGLLVAGVVAAGALAAWLYVRSQTLLPAGQLAGRLPHGDRPIARIDVDALRQAGLLERMAGKAGIEDTDYRQFVAETGFDYRRDLDAVLAAYRPAETHFFLRGRFDWRKLEAYARKQGGECRDGTCRMDSSTPGRRIAFRMADRATLALASGSDAAAVERLSAPADPLRHLPSEPVWVMLPPPVLKDKDSLPAGTRIFMSAVEDAERVTLAIGARQNRFEAALEARFAAPAQAESAQRQMQAATELLNKMMARDKQTPNPRNLTGVLSGGQFRVDGAVLKGAWPVEESFLEELGR